MDPFQRYPTVDVPSISLRPQQAADALGVSLSTLGRLKKSGQIRAAKIGRCTVYAVDSLKAWLASQTEGGNHAAH
jgi:excisionase family DNA binding protein